MRKQDLMYHRAYKSMYELLSAYEKAGVGLTLSGRPSTARELAYVCTAREDVTYMSDYIPDNNGKLCEIRFDKVCTQ